MAIHLTAQARARKLEVRARGASVSAVSMAMARLRERQLLCLPSLAARTCTMTRNLSSYRHLLDLAQTPLVWQVLE